MADSSCGRVSGRERMKISQTWSTMSAMPAVCRGVKEGRGITPVPVSKERAYKIARVIPAYVKSRVLLLFSDHTCNNSKERITLSGQARV